MVGVVGLLYLDALIVGQYLFIFVMPFMRGSLVARVSVLRLGLGLGLGKLCVRVRVRVLSLV